MTDFETQSLAIARAALSVAWWADVVAACALVAVILGGIVAFRTLKVIIAQLDSARWNSLLSFEQDMASRRTKFHEIAAQMQTDAPTYLLRAVHLEAKESYFNSLDRLASSILNGQFPDREMKQDYHEAITAVVRAFPEDFTTGTHYRKVVKLYNRWQDAT
jgi:hypothetical protein